MRNDSADGRTVGTHSEAHFPEEHIPDGRPPIATRHVLEAVLWILNTGAQWHMLPQRYPNYKTVHRRFQTWCCNEVLRRVLTDVANELRDKGALDEEECLRCDVRHGQRWRVGSRNNEARKRHEDHGVVDRHGLPLSVSTHAANHHEVRLVQLCFDFYMIEAKPENLIGDRAYDSDPLDEELRNAGIEMIAPHRSNRSKPPHARSATAEPFDVGSSSASLLEVAAPYPCSLGVPRSELPGLCAARQPCYPLQAILRTVLVSREKKS